MPKCKTLIALGVWGLGFPPNLHRPSHSKIYAEGHSEHLGGADGVVGGIVGCVVDVMADGYSDCSAYLKDDDKHGADDILRPAMALNCNSLLPQLSMIVMVLTLC